MLSPAVRHDRTLASDHPCHGCPVRTVAVCGVLDCDELAQFRSHGSHSRLSAGQPLFHEGDPAERVFTVTRGSLKLYKLLPDGRRQVTGFMHAGDFLGVSVNNEHAFTAEALEPTQLCSFPGPRFDSFVEGHATMERELYRLAAHEAAAAHEQFVLLGRKTATERVASFVLSLAERAERREGIAARLVDIPMSRSDIADYLGLTKETVSRVLALLKGRRLIRLEAIDCIEILDRAGLEQTAAGDLDP